MAHAIAGNGHTPADSPLNLQAEFENSPRSAMNLLQQCRYKIQNNRTVRRAARTVSDAAHYVHDHSPQDMAEEIQRLVRRNPGAALVIAAAVGFLVGRFLNRLNREVVDE
ncbi:MAG TPA: hypothetical protein VNV86_21030 [Candidatus Acidoferrum sp.]|jgi:ElaB/YqjD/DUF883 family membrane-anchored ribosome-binding protein|nr:hypothetical protein [Candidatus Acidoferrum sp.]